MTSHRRLVSALLVLLLGVVVTVLVARVSAERTVPAAALPETQGSGFPLRFEPSLRGERTVASADALGGTVSLDGGALAMRGANDGWRLMLDGAAPGAKTIVSEASQGPTRFLTAGDRLARPYAMTTYRSVRVEAVYPGIDLTAAGTTDRVTLSLTIAAHEDRRAAFRIEGATARIETDGSVRWSTPSGEYALLPPSAWRGEGDGRAPLPARFEMNAAGAIELVVPEPLESAATVETAVWAKHLAGPDLMVARAGKIALDAEGAAYVAGSVPARSGDVADGGDAFVGKLDREGRDFLWITYLGTNGTDGAGALAIDRSGRIAVAGSSGDDAFVSELAPDGSLVWSRNIHGSADDAGTAVTFDASGRIWVAGTTASLDLPVTGATAHGGTDAFVARVAADGTLELLSYVGGAADDSAAGLVATGTGVALAGETRSTDLGTTGAAQAAPGGGRDVFVTMLTAGGSIERTTYLGGPGDETAAGIALDRAGRIVVASGQDGDASLVILSPDASTLESSTRIGGPGDDEPSSLAVDHAGRMLIAGHTSGGFPAMNDPGRAVPRGGVDAFVATIDADGRTLMHAGLIGGDAADVASSVAVDGNGRVWLAGATASTELSDGRVSHTLAEGGGGFVATIDDRPASTAPAGSCPGTRSFDGGPTGTGTAWTTAANWSGDTLPVAGDDVCIDGFAVVMTSGANSAGTLHVQGAGSLTLDGGSLTIAGTSEIVSPATLSLSGATLTGAGNLSIATAFTWVNGTMSGTGTTTANGGMALGGGYMTLTRPLRNASGGTATHTGLAYALIINSPGVFNNQAGATYDQQSDASITGTGPFNNGGAFLRTTSAGISAISTPFNNTGTVDVQSGTLRIGDNGAHTGDFDATGAILDFNAGTQAFSGTSDITGTEVDFSGASVTLSGTYNVTGKTSILGSGSVNFTGGTLNLIDVGNDLSVAGGTVTFSSGETLTPTTVELTGGVLTGSDAIQIGGLFTWSSGTMAGTGVTTASGGIAHGGSYMTLTRTLNNVSGSTATYTGPAYGLIINTPGVYNNQAGATFDHQVDANITGTGVFNNAGTFLRTTSANAIAVSTVFNNTGTVDVQSGTLRFGDNGTHSGDFDATGAVLEFNGGTHTFSAASGVTGTRVKFSGGTCTLSGTYNVTGETEIAGGTVNFTGGTLDLIDTGSLLTVSGGTATFSSGEAVTPDAMTLSGGTFTGTDALTVGGLLTWSAGTMSGTGSTTTNGGIALGGSYETLARTLNNTSGSTVVNSGPTYGFIINAPGVFNNQSGATWDQQSDANVSGTGTFNNAGTFLRTTSALAVSLGCQTVNNTGVIDVQSGTLKIGGNGTHTGDFDSTGAILEFDSGTHTLAASSDVTGSKVKFSGANVTMSGTYDVANETEITAGTVNFNGAGLNLIDVGSLLTVSGGITTFASGEAVTPTTMNFQGGTIGGPDNITVGGLLTWVSGIMGGTGLTTTSGGIALGGLYETLNRTLNNTSGSNVVNSGPAYALTINAPGAFNNLAGASWDQRSDALVNGGGVFNNFGTYIRTTSSGPATIDCIFNNTGTVDVQSGELRITGDGTHTGDFDCTGAVLEFGANGTQTFSAASDITGTEVRFTGGTQTLSGTYDITGNTLISGGTVNFTGATLNVIDIGADLQVGAATATFSSGEVIAPATLTQTSGTITGSDAISVSGLLTWHGGTMSGTGVTTVNGGMDLGNLYLVLDRTMINANNGTATYVGPAYAMTINAPGAFNNQAGSTFDYQTDAAFTGDGVFNNAGTFVRSTAGTGSVHCPFDNTGTVNVTSGVLYFSGGSGGVGNYTQTAGTTRLNGGELQTYQSLNIAGGTLTGTGKITGPVANTGGSLAPGQSPGSLNIDEGNYTQGAGGTYAVEIGGTTPVTEHDVLDVTGAFANTTTLNGTLAVTLVNGFTPSLGDSFTIINTVNRAGTFSGTSFPPLGGGNVWQVIYNPTTVVLVVAPPTNADVDVANTDAPDPVNAGGDITYTITVHNNGPDPATNVSLSDTLPASTAFVSATPSQGTCSQAAGTVTCPIGGLAVSSTATVTVVVTTSGASVPSIGNTASATATEADLVPANNSVTATTTVNPVADLSITKTDTPDPVQAGGTITYTIGVANAGPNDATSVSMTDTLPAGSSFVSATGTGWTCGSVANIVTCTRPSLPVGAAPDITLTITAPGTPGSIDNTATVTAAEFDPVLPNSATATTNVTPVADLSITTGDAPDPVDAGADLVYTLNVSDAGPSAATAVSVTDTLPAGAGFISATGTGWTCNHASGVVTCTRATLAVGAAPAITLTVTAPSEGGTISNGASVTATEFDPTSPNTASEDTTVTPIADLSVVKTDGPDPVNVGSALTYTLTVSNEGPSDAANVTVTDTLPGTVSFVSAAGTGWTCGEAGGVVTCTRPSLATGAAPAITIDVTAPAGTGPISNTAIVAATTIDLVPANNTDTEGTTVTTATSDLSITKTDGADPVDAGASLVYTLDVTNAGPDAASTVTVTDPLPAGVTFFSATGTGWTCGNVSGTVTCTRPSLAVGAAPAITITVNAPAEGGLISNTATVSASEADGTPGNNSSSASTTVTSIADLTIVKNDSPDPVAAGGALTYTIDVSNAGPSTAATLSMGDVLPAGVSFVSATGTGWTCANAIGTVTCTRPSLAIGAAPTITIDVTAPETPGPLSNTATVTAATSDPTAPNSSTTTTNVTAVADLSISKGDAPDPVDAGAALLYTLNVGNAGPSAASAVSVTDTLPTGVAFVAASGTGWACNNAFGTVTCTRATLAVGAAPPITITVNAPAAGGSITNDASVTAAEFDPTTPNTASATTTVTPHADLSIAKTDSPDPVSTSSSLTYTVTVTNLGPSAADTLSMADSLPAGVAFVSASGAGWSCGEATGIVTCTRTSLAVGVAPAISIVVTTGAVPGSITNSATIAAASPSDPAAANNTAIATTSVDATADLAIVKTASASTVATNSVFTYTLAVSNAGSGSAGTVTVTDILPANLTYQSVTGTGWTCSQVSETVTCTRANLATGSAPPITITVRAPNSVATIVNTATVATANDPSAADNSSAATVDVTASADLRVTKTASTATIVDDSDLTYTISVRNAGPAAATSVVMTDNLPGDAEFISASGNGWACAFSSGTLTCTRASLAVTTAPAIAVRVHVFTDGKTGTLCNSASAGSAESDPTPSNDVGTACVEVVEGGGACNSLDDLLDQVDEGQIAAAQRRQMESFLRATIGAAGSGKSNVVIQRLALFRNQVNAAAAHGACDAKTAEALTSCAAALRQQYLAGAGQGATRR